MGRQAMASIGGTETEMVRSMEQTQHPALRGALTGLVRHAERPAFAHVGADAALGHVRAAAATLRVGEMPARLALMDTASIVSRADDVMRGVFYFTKPWDMERCATPFELPANPYEIDWCVVNNDDEEWCFMLNRMDYLEDLAAAFLVTGDVEYARHALDLVLAWVAAHPAIEPRLSTRTLDTGIRLRSWVRVLPVLEFAGVLGLDSIARILRSAGDQIDYLGERYLPKYETSNWGSIQTCAIVETVLMLAGAGNDEGCYAWALERLASQLPAQVYPDGVDWELSPMYHIEVMLYVLGARAALERCGLEVLSSIDNASRGLSRGLAMQTMPGCVIDAVGDSDRLAVNGVAALSAALLRSSTFPGWKPWTPLTLWPTAAVWRTRYPAFQPWCRSNALLMARIPARTRLVDRGDSKPARHCSLTAPLAAATDIAITCMFPCGSTVYPCWWIPAVIPTVRTWICARGLKGRTPTTGSWSMNPRPALLRAAGVIAIFVSRSRLMRAITVDSTTGKVPWWSTILAPCWCVRPFLSTRAFWWVVTRRIARAAIS